MKKIGISLLALTLLIGCAKKVENLENKIEPELDHEEIMAGDFSSLNVKTDDGFGYGIEVYGIGVEVPEYEGLTDITKIRVYRGQAGPMSVEEIFNKQE